MPIHHNPAFTGYMNGDVRVAADFKMQWESFGDGFGNAYLPEWNFDGLGNLERGFGYQIKMAEGIENYNICNH